MIYFSTFGVAQSKNPIYVAVNIAGQEGMTSESDLKMIGQKKYLSTITEFEKQFLKNGSCSLGEKSL